MKRLMMCAVLGVLLAGATGCRIGECWRSAWASRRPPQQMMVCSDSCVVSESCDPCGGGTIVSSPAPCSSCVQ